MAYFKINYYSETINKNMDMIVVLPTGDYPVKRDKNGNYAVLYLVHGYTSDYSKWHRLTSIERYADQYGIAVVMPDVGKSFYQDMVYGDPHFTHLTEELPNKINAWFKITSDPDYTFIAGNSMGGYGAMKVALTYPDRFNAAGTLSGALVIGQIDNIGVDSESPLWLQRLKIDLPLAFGDLSKVKGSENDLFHLLKENKSQGKVLPRLFVCCGTDDFVYDATVAFSNALNELKIPFRYSEEKAEHTWDYWDREILKFIELICEDERMK